MTYLETAERYAQAWLWWRQERNLVEAGFHGAVADRTEPSLPDMEVLIPAPPLAERAQGGLLATNAVMKMIHVRHTGRKP